MSSDGTRARDQCELAPRDANEWHDECSLSGMLKKILIMVGLAKAPTPVKSYVAASSVFGALPAIAWVAWRNRDAIRRTVHRMRLSAPPATSAT